MKCDCNNGNVFNVIRELILYGFGLDEPPGHKIYKKPRIKPLKTTKKSVLSHNKLSRRQRSQIS